MPGEPCAFSGTGPDGYHITRFAGAEANRLISAADFDSVLESIAGDPFGNATLIYDGVGACPDEDDEDELGGLEPYCAECGR
jgi:hypothetical protein